jgi:hypothetical protein
MNRHLKLEMTILAATVLGLTMLSTTAFAVTLPLPLGTSTYQIAPPLGAATAGMPMIWNLPIQDPINVGKALVVPIPVTNIPVFNPATETAVQASARKAAAVKAAIDAAVTAGTLPNNVSATVKPGLVLGVIGKDALGRPIIGLVPGGLSWIQIGA